eukprot:c5139_g1_i2.p1 GENE.c5139_g1_i2~~c5139_g1_i2.p1  ORF type:complete len:435 (+),score=104.41 c5139_g1_i2:1-1305(+)
MGVENKPPMKPEACVVLDNGAGFVRAGFAGETDPKVTLGNCVGRYKNKKLVGIHAPWGTSAHATPALRRPLDRGYLVNSGLEQDVWDLAFSSMLDTSAGKRTYSQCNLVVTQAPFPLPACSTLLAELALEKYGFASVLPVMTLDMAAEWAAMESRYVNWSGVVVDTGFSFSHAGCVHRTKTLQPSVKRLNVGGKIMTNYLKEVISYRAWNMMDETLLINHIKEQLCFVSDDFARDLRATHKDKANNDILREYVLPDHETSHTGFVRDPELTRSLRKQRKQTDEDGNSKPVEDQQVLVMNNERICVPELLFQPPMVGVPQRGLSDVIAESISLVPNRLHPTLYSNVLLVGGNANIPGMKTRIESELRSIAPDHMVVNVILPKHPELCVWRGASSHAHQLLESGNLKQAAITKAQWAEHGARLFMPNAPPLSDIFE